MCSPGAAFGANMGIQSLGTLANAYGARLQHKAQMHTDEKRSEMSKLAADFGLKVQNEQIGDADRQDQEATAVELLATKVQAMKTRSAAVTQAGESGTSGASVNEVITDIEHQQAAREGILQTNLKNRRKQRRGQRLSAGVEYVNQLATGQAPFRPNPVNLGATGLEIAGHASQNYMDYTMSRKVKSDG